MKALEGMKGEVIVVDNASMDGSREYLESRFPCVKFTWNGENKGFAVANNQAISGAGGRFILFLNPDTILAEDTFSICLDFMQKHPDAGAMGVTMIDGSGGFLKESKRAYPSLWTSFFKMSGLTSLFPTSPVFAKYHLGHLDPHKNHEVDVLAGAFFFTRKDVLDKTGGFDETFFMYGEDIDLSYRIQQQGYKNYYCAETSIIHFKGESTKKGTLNYVRLFYKAMMIFVQKHYSHVTAGLFRFFINIAIWLRAVVSAIAGFIKKNGLPIIDAALILMSFITAKLTWNQFVKPDIIYEKGLLTIAFPAFTLIFLTASYYAGLYDRQQKRGRLIRSTLFAMIALLSIYSLLPETMRFSRAILLLGTLFAFILISIDRWVLRKLNWIEIEDAERMGTIIVGTPAEYKRAADMMQLADKEGRILGRVGIEKMDEHCLTTIDNLSLFLRDIPVREIIFCQGSLSFREIIGHCKKLLHGVRIRITSPGSGSIVGSDSSKTSGEIVSVDLHFDISKPFNRRFKRLIDILFSLVMIIGFPIHILFVKRPGQMLGNAFSVLGSRKSWIGYSSKRRREQEENGHSLLPVLKPGIIGVNGLPSSASVETEDGLFILDQLYARDYTPYLDIYLITKGYMWLGT
jgi:GT2 family glycosyltransferase